MSSFPCFLTPNRLQPTLPLFVFLPGMDGTGQLLRTQTEGLEAGFDVRCLAIPPTDVTGWDELASQVITLTKAELDKVRDRPVYLCGESFGACLALKVAAQMPQLFTRLIVINPASSFRRRPWLNWGGPITNLLPDPLYHLSTLSLIPWLANLERIAPGDRRALLEAIRIVPKSTSVWRLALLSEFALSDAELERLQMPVLLMAGERDRLLPSVEEVEQLAAQLPQAQVLRLPLSGHTCLLEEGINLYDLLQEKHWVPRLEIGAQGGF
jgi:pimeloyl-ACP methyl ester carboxylesterase